MTRKIELRVYVNDVPIKSLKMYSANKLIYVEEIERLVIQYANRELDKITWRSSFLDNFERSCDARVAFLGRANMLAYEEGNPTEPQFGSFEQAM